MKISSYSKFIFLQFVLVRSIASGGYEVGNGAEVVVCRDNNLHITSVELLDIFEARTAKGISSSEFEERYYRPSYWQESLYKMAPRRAAVYERYINKFDEEATFFKDKILPKTYDSGLMTKLPESCALEQLVVQIASAHPYDSQVWKGRYSVSNYLWNKLSPLNQAAAKLHEAVYRERIKQCVDLQEGKCFPQTFTLVSEGVRKIVGNIVADNISSMNMEQFSNLLKDAGLRRVERSGLVFVDKIPKNLPIKDIRDSVPDQCFAADIHIDLTPGVWGDFENFVVSDFIDSKMRDDIWYNTLKLKFGKNAFILPRNFKVKKDGEVIKISPAVGRFENIGQFHEDWTRYRTLSSPNEIWLNTRDLTVKIVNADYEKTALL